MSDRFLFRGKRKTDSGWTYGNYRYTDTVNGKIHAIYPCIPPLGNAEEWEIDPTTVGQSTGLKDKNGTLIFEGDIVRGIDWSEDEVYPIVWWRHGWYINCPDNYEDIEDMDKTQDLIVVGNIHDNPEMLEQGGARQ